MSNGDLKRILGNWQQQDKAKGEDNEIGQQSEWPRHSILIKGIGGSSSEQKRLL